MSHKMLAAFPRSHGSWHLAGVSPWEALGEAGVWEEGRGQGISSLLSLPLVAFLTVTPAPKE